MNPARRISGRLSVAMQVPRFFAVGQDLARLELLFDEKKNQTGQILTLSEIDLIKQLLHVLRLRKNDRFILVDSISNIYKLEIAGINKTEIECRVISLKRGAPDTRIRVEVGLALIKPDRFEWCIEKLTELGANSIQPLYTRRSRQRADKELNRSSVKLNRWQKIAREAAEQCERSAIPVVEEAVGISDYLKSLSVHERQQVRVICAERRQAAPLAEAVRNRIYSQATVDIVHIDSLILLVGPEGGFTQDEMQAAIEAGFLPVTLGARILRSETAAIAALAQMQEIM